MSDEIKTAEGKTENIGVEEHNILDANKVEDETEAETKAEDEVPIIIDIVDQENEYKEWMSFADMDLSCAKYLNEAPMHPRPLNAICFHCQQAADDFRRTLGEDVLERLWE